MNAIRPLKNLIKLYKILRIRFKPKLFCVGFNKTGTTSLEKEMQLQGYLVGNQRKAELLFDDWVNRDFKRIIRYCYSGQFFQDIPFSLPYTFIILDQAFPKSKFILTVRDNPNEWYDSLIHFHGKLWGNGNVPPTNDDLKRANYIYKGFPYHARFKICDVPNNEPYNKKILISQYNRHINNVKDYFRHRPNDLIVINLKKSEDYSRFCQFVGYKQERDNFPWLNKT